MSDLKERFAELDTIPYPDLIERVESAMDALSTSPSPAERLGGPVVPLASTRHRHVPSTVPKWRALPGWVYAWATAALVLLSVGGGVWLSSFLGEETPPAITQATTPIPGTTLPPSTLPPTTTPPATPSTTVLPAPESWSSILAETKARPVASPAECSAFSMPPTQEVLPWPRPHSGYAATVDQQAAQAVLFDDYRTWLFDVCTNTWTLLGNRVDGLRGQLIYDVDSDKVISFGGESVHVFNKDTGEWTSSALPEPGLASMGVAYDSVSGLVIAQDWYTGELFSAYDVDTDTWTTLGRLPEGPVAGMYAAPTVLLGYSQALDRLIVTGYFGPSTATFLVDPRTGQTEVIETPSPRLHGFGWGEDGPWGPAADSVIIVDDLRPSDARRSYFHMTGFNLQTLTWTDSFALPDEADIDASVVFEDKINNRLLVVGWSTKDLAEVLWARDLNTGEWTLIPFAVHG